MTYIYNADVIEPIQEAPTMKPGWCCQSKLRVYQVEIGRIDG